MGFALSIIKFNQDVVGRCFTVLLNLHFHVKIDAPAEHGKVAGEVTTHETAPVVHLAEAAMSEMLTPGLGKMYVIQAGLVIVPIFFFWLVAHRARVEEV